MQPGWSDWQIRSQAALQPSVARGTLERLPRNACRRYTEQPIALALTFAAIQAGYTARYRSAFDLAQDLAEADATGTRKDMVQQLTRVNLLVIEDLGMRRLPATAAEDLLEVFTRRYETAATVLTTNRPVEDWGQILGNNAAAGAILDRFLHHAEIIRLNGRSYRMFDRQQHHPDPGPTGPASERK